MGHMSDTLLWLGFSWPENAPLFAAHDRAGRYAPPGVHGRNRQRLVRRHTRPRLLDAPLVDGRREWTPRHLRAVGLALARTYPMRRENAALFFIRPHRLDDSFWRMVYAVMVQGGPVDFGSLVMMVHDLTANAATADRCAIALYQERDRFARWLHRRSQRAGAE